MIIESTIIYENGDFVWYHEVQETKITLKGDVIERADLLRIINVVGDCKNAEIYRRDNGSICLVVTYEDFATLEAVSDICHLFGHNPKNCTLNFFAVDHGVIQVRISLYDDDDIPF